MKQLLYSLCILLLALADYASLARESEGARENSVLLNGPWEFVRGDGGEGAESPAAQQQLKWEPVQLPGPFMRYSREAANQTRVVWARRAFNVTTAQTQNLAVLRWNRIANGAVAFINGQKVGENEPTGPYQVIVRPGVLKPGENQIVLKVRGAASVRKSKSGNALIPAGFGVGMPEVTDDVWLDFADTAYMKWVLALPDLAASRVKIRATLTGLQRAEDLRIVAQVKSGPNGQVIGEGQVPARLVPDPDPLGGEHFFVDVPMAGFQPWTYEKCPLYYGRVKLFRGAHLLDEVTFRFGMREIGVKDRRYTLNGKSLWLRGSNLVFEWNWGDTITGHELDYLVTEAREMSMNSFRTHTQPPPRLWADICDEHGTMILAEFPVLYNYQDYQFTPEEYDLWHRNCLLDAAGWMARLWNHPSVIMWVLSNESRGDNRWEEGPFQDFVNTLDPTRPTMRTGTTGTKENYDVHACGNITETDEGNLQPQIRNWFKDAGERTTTCSEYMNFFGHPRTQWTGVDDGVANALAVAQIGAEHTEAMRRARLDAILPYMYAGWTRTRQAARVRETGKGSAVWKAGYAAPESAAWHSSLSPVLASLDLFDANYRPGEEVTTDLHLINDSWHDAKIHVDLLLTRECPEFIPEAECFDRPVRKWSFDFATKADSIEKKPVTWRLPDEEGAYWLTARMTGEPGRPVLSQRFVHAIRPPTISDASQQRTFVVLGSSDAARAFFKSKGLRISDQIAQLLPETHVVVIWNATHLTENEKSSAKTLCDFAARGGRIVVLSTPTWNWPELCDVKIGKARRFSRVFPDEPAARSVLQSFNPEWLIRWNGFPGTVGLGPLEGPAMTLAEKLLWAKEPQTTVAALLPAAEGSGRILFLQLDLQRRLDTSRPYYDPAAERLLVSLLAAGAQSGLGQRQAAHDATGPTNGILPPLVDLGPGQTYHGQEGGLYPGGSNVRPAAHDAAGQKIARGIVPLDAEGKPDTVNGKIVIMPVSVSNGYGAWHRGDESDTSTTFMTRANANPARNPKVFIAYGFEYQLDGGNRGTGDPGPNSPFYRSLDHALKEQGVTPRQVQIVWLSMPVSGRSWGTNLPPEARTFPADAQQSKLAWKEIVHAIYTRYPNVKIIYSSTKGTMYMSATPTKNPEFIGGPIEPFNHDAAWGVKWVIEDQINGAPDLNYDPARGPVRAPWLSWGPYFWSYPDGAPRHDDGFSWSIADVAADGLHPSLSGLTKYANLLLHQMTTDPTATPWFLKPGASPNKPPTIARAASVAADPVTGATTALSVLGADDEGEPNLTYTWSCTGPAGVTFTVNGPNRAKNTTATFPSAGRYTFEVTIADAGGLAATSSIVVTVTRP